jgi:chaperonin GroEL
MNKTQGKFTAIAVRRPETLEDLEDIAALVGAEAITKAKDIVEIKPEHCGKAKKVIVTADRTVIVADENERTQRRIEEVTKAIEQSDERYGAIEDLKDRLARLKGGIAKIKVGARTAAEQTYLKMKIDDAVGATRAAMAEGVVEGAGATLKRISARMDLGTTGARILSRAFEQPYYQLLENAGIKPKNGNFYNVFTGEVIKNLYDAGIIDPAKVTRCVIQNAVSAAKTILTTEAVVVEVPEPQKESKGSR